MSETPTRVLVAEDELLVRMIMVEVLTDRGFDVLEASNGSEALQLLEHPDRVELVVTDINMPAPDGIAVAQQARAQHSAIPIVFVTARPDQLDNSVAPRPHRVLTKPFTMVELTNLVDEMLERK